MNSVLAQSDWFLYLGISCTIHPRAKQNGVSSFVSVTEGIKFVLNKRSGRARVYQKATKSGNKLFRDMFFFYRQPADF